MDGAPPDPPHDPPAIADMREAFARASGERDPEAERAFAESKLALVRSDPTLSPRQREAAIAEIEAKLRAGRAEP